ncbi:hypothetical protein V9T40_006445 [Parthenolecanium corni]|uniref:FYVE-type domain-containing protein n=1 Tax=Parthenolecanium corni TaxID=536013 RepID=A0AAN9TK30_9HEMI
MAEGSDNMREGFICPICLTDQKTMTKLHSHFHEVHSDDAQITKIFKGMMGLSKKIIKPTDFDDSVKYSPRKELIHSLEIYNTHQELGARRGHFETFQEIRNRRLEGFAAETNKLIIRLDKLLLNLPSDPNRKKLYEQTVVPWIDGEDVSRCPECTKSFHFARRQHHCRLCGSIMCHDCSSFLPLSKAKSILSRGDNGEASTDDVSEENNFRICRYCLNLLESRESMKASRNCNPLIAQLYEKARDFMKELAKDADLYQEMSLSLNEGKSMYNLHDARELWDKIIKLSEKISFLSTKIASMGVTENSCDLSDKQMKLQKAVGMGMNGYIQSKILSLPSLPSEELYAKKQEDRRRRIDREIRKEKQEDRTDALLDSQVKTEYVHSKPAVSKLQENVTVDEGWIPEVGSNMQHNNPLIQQMDNIRNYIKQAREAYKFDEVASLEENLRELQEEYYRQQS